MAITRVEFDSDVRFGGTRTCDFATPTTIGELIVVVWSANGGLVPTMTDSGSQSYTSIYALTVSGAHGYGLSYKANSASGITSVTATMNGGGTQGGLIAAHYTGITTTSPLDVNGGTPTSDAGTAWTSATVTTTQADELLIGPCYGVFNGTNATMAASGSWTEFVQLSTSGDFDGNNGFAMSCQQQIVSSIQTNIANTGTGPAATNFFAGIATFKGEVSAAGVPWLLRSEIRNAPTTTYRVIG